MESEINKSGGNEPKAGEGGGATLKNPSPDGEGRTKLEPHSPTAHSPFGPGNQPAGIASAEGFPQSLEGRYKLLRMLGKGGFATVYLAQDSVLDQQVAIKVLRLDMANQADRDRFLREARIGARLRHPNIAQVYDIILAADGLQMIMEFCPGGTLGELIKSKGALKPARAIQIARQAGQALAYAHQHQFIHRDIKPANIFFMKDGSVKLGDFGIAANTTSHEYTQTGMIIGTPIYMAPEQSSDSRDVDPRADIYSLGLTLYVMLTGHSPRVIDLDLVPAPFRSLIKHSTSPDRNHRMVSAEQFCAMLDRIEKELKSSRAGEVAGASSATSTKAVEEKEQTNGGTGASTAEKAVAGEGAGPTSVTAYDRWNAVKAVALGGGIVVIIVLLSAITVMLVKQNQAQRTLGQTSEAVATPIVKATASPAPVRTPAPPQLAPPRNEPPTRPLTRSVENHPARIRERMANGRPTIAREVQNVLPAAPIVAPTDTPLPNLSLTGGLNALLGSSRELEMAFQNFKSYDKLEPLTRRLTIANGLDAIRNSLDQAIKTRPNEVPLLHMLTGYAFFRQGRMREAHDQIEQARASNRRLVRPYQLDDRAEWGRVFDLDQRGVDELFGHK